MRTIQMSSYTVGEDCFDAIPSVLAPHRAESVVLVGGKRALAAAAPGIRAALGKTQVKILDEIVYGTDSTQSTIDALVDNEAFRAADIAFAIGGGKAIDTVKTAAQKLSKIVFSVPTICSNCSSATTIAVVYNDDHSFKGYVHMDAPAHVFIQKLSKIVFSVPTICSNCSSATTIAVVYNDDHSFKGYVHMDAPAHVFINPAIIAAAPDEYFWAGIGDALSKQPEVEYATSEAELTHTGTLGLNLAHTCTEPLMTYGEQGLADVRAGRSSEAVRQIALDIVVNTGYVSNLTNQPDFYYNSSLAHAFYNATTGIPRPGRVHLHGEVVSFGVLVLFAYIGDTAELQRYASFNKKLGLPVTLAELDLDESHLPRIAELAQETKEWAQAHPAPFSPEAFIEAIKAADAFGRNLG